jgi:hypothetical protein
METHLVGYLIKGFYYDIKAWIAPFQFFPRLKEKSSLAGKLKFLNVSIGQQLSLSPIQWVQSICHKKAKNREKEVFALNYRHSKAKKKQAALGT